MGRRSRFLLFLIAGHAGLLVLYLECVIKEFSERPVRIMYRIEDGGKFVRGASSRPICMTVSVFFFLFAHRFFRVEGRK